MRKKTLQTKALLLVISAFLFMTDTLTLVVDELPPLSPHLEAKINETLEEIDNGNEDWQNGYREFLTNTNDEQVTCQRLKNFVNVMPAVNRERSLLDKIRNPIEKIKTNYRALAYTLLTNESQYNDSIAFKKGLKAVKLLDLLKARYFNQFIKNDTHEDYSAQHKEALNKEYEQLMKKYSEVDKSYSKIEGEIGEMLNQIEDVQENLKDLDGFETKLVNLKITQKILDELGSVESDEEYYILNTEELVMISQKNVHPLYILDTLFNYTEKIKMFIEVFDNIELIIHEEKEANPEMEQEKLEKYNSIHEKIIKLMKVMKEILNKKREEFKPQLKIVKENVSERKEKLFKEITENEEYKKYKNLIIQIKSKNDAIVPVQKEFFTLQKKKHEIEFKLGKIKENKILEMVIPKTEIFELSKRIAKQIKQLEYIATFHKQSVEDGKSKTDKSKIEANNLLIDSKEILEKKLAENEAKLEQINHINALESHVDMALGYLFAKVYIMKDNTKCFLLSQLSYYFFNLILNNLVIDESVFLKEFLLLIPEIDAKLFIMSNYKIFANEDFYKSKMLEYQKTAVSNLNSLTHKQIIQEYTVNFGMVINMYKDMKKNMSKTKTFTLVTKSFVFAGIYFAFYHLFSLIVDIGSDAGLTNVMTVIAEILISLIPFLGAIPFLKILTVKILTRIYKVIYFLLSKIFKFAAPKIMKILGFLKGKMLERNLKSYVFDLDSIKETKTGLSFGVSKSSPSSDFEKLGEKYGAIHNLEAWNDDPDNVNLYNNEIYHLSVTDLLINDEFIKYKKLELYGMFENDPEFYTQLTEREQLSNEVLLNTPNIMRRRRRII